MVEFLYNLVEIDGGENCLSDNDLQLNGIEPPLFSQMWPKEIAGRGGGGCTKSSDESSISLVFRFIEVWSIFLPRGQPRSLLLPLVLEIMERKVIQRGNSDTFSGLASHTSNTYDEKKSPTFIVCTLQILIIIVVKSMKMLSGSSGLASNESRNLVTN